MKITVDDRNKGEMSTEERILRAAETEFINKGFDGARTTAIAEAAGVTHAMFHYYFRTKKNLFERIVSGKINAVTQLISKAFGPSEKPLFERLSCAISDHLDFLSENPELPRFMITQLYMNKERMDIMLAKLKNMAGDVIADLQSEIDKCASEGVCRKTDARLLILDILSLNMFSFIATPATDILLGDFNGDLKSFVELRKRENIKTILSKVLPNG